MIRAILFDVYGTLISTGNGSIQAAEKIIRLNGREDISPHDFYGQWKKLHRAHIDKLENFVPERIIFEQDLYDLYQQYGFQRDSSADIHFMLDTLGRRHAFPETKEVLERLSLDYLLAIGSTTDTEPLLQDITRNALPVTKIFTSESMEVYKPQADFYLQILKALHLRAEEALFVGDSLLDDVWGPQQVGMKTCWVNRKKSEKGPYTADYEIHCLTQLLEICKG